MQLLSTSEYELGFIAIGSTPVGVIAIGGVPVGVIAVGIVPMGLMSFACGVGVGIGCLSCGIGLGGFVRAVGVAVGADAEATGLPIALGGSERSSWYWTCMALVTAAVSMLLFQIGQERIAITRMSRIVEVTWSARPTKSEGIYIEPQTACRIHGLLRSDGIERLHARLRVSCGSLELVERHIRSGCTVQQVAVAGGHAYRLACARDRVAASEDDDDVTPELPGLVFDTLESPGRARVYAHGPPPMNIELQVTSPSEVIDSHPLLLPGARIEAPAGGQ